MKWNIKIDEYFISEALFFIKKQMKRIKIKEISKINIKWGSPTYSTVYGICRFRDKRKKLGYRISCFLPVYGPGEVLTRGEYPKIRKRKYIVFANFNEALVWLWGHEIFHYLCHNKQISGANKEERADNYGDLMLKKYKKFTNRNYKN